MNHYDNFEDYVNDKKRIYASQSKMQYTLCNYDDPRGREFHDDTSATSYYFSESPLPGDGFFLKDNTGYASLKGEVSTLLFPEVSIRGGHNRINLLCAAACAYLYGADIPSVRERLARFSGIPHRMEFVASKNGTQYYNDSAATIPQAAIHALQSFSKPVHIICGGTDKECDFTGFAEALSSHHIYLLEGTATDIFIKELKEKSIPYSGPFNTLGKAFDKASRTAGNGDIVILSPGATSFGMFLNEFDRGNQYKDLVNNLDD